MTQTSDNQEFTWEISRLEGIRPAVYDRGSRYGSGWRRVVTVVLLLAGVLVGVVAVLAVGMVVMGSLADAGVAAGGLFFVGVGVMAALIGVPMYFDHSRHTVRNLLAERMLGQPTAVIKEDGSDEQQVEIGLRVPKLAGSGVSQIGVFARVDRVELGDGSEKTGDSGSIWNERRLIDVTDQREKGRNRVSAVFEFDDSIAGADEVEMTVMVRIVRSGGFDWCGAAQVCGGSSGASR